MIANVLSLVLALQGTAAPSPAPAAQSPTSRACNYPPEVVRLAPVYVSRSFALTFPGVRQAVVAVTLDDQGQVIDAKIIGSASESFMNIGALDAARNSVYAPGAVNCKPVGGTIDVTIAFQQGDYSCDRDADVLRQASAEVPPSAFAGQPLGTEKTATVTVKIGTDGTLLSAKLAQSTGNPVMDAAALRAAQQSTYSPKMEHCHGVVAEALFKVSFFRNQ